jgi:hypothetical protein
LKLIIASIVIFSLVILFLFSLFPADITVSRVVQIKSSPEQVLKKVADLREWSRWNALLINADDKKNPTPVFSDANLIRKGEFTVELLKSTPDTVITRWQQQGKAFTGNFILTQMDNQVMLDWTLHFHLRWYPWEKLASMFYDKQLGPVMEKSLLNLRNELESPPQGNK